MSGIEFTVDPTPKPEPKVITAETSVPADKVITNDAAPMLEVEQPVKAEVKKVAVLTKNQNRMAQKAMRDPEDPSVLLQGMLGQMPGMTSTLAADMAIGTSQALNNLGASANRIHDLAQRAKRAERPSGRKGFGRR